MNHEIQLWNRMIGLMCSSSGEDPLEYKAQLLVTIGLCELTASENPDIFKVNRMARGRLSNWIKQFSNYEEFADGCWLLVCHYNTESVLKNNYETLVEMHRRWSSVINLSLHYGNSHQVDNFVNFARKQSDLIVEEMLRRKRKNLDKGKIAAPNFELDAKQVKEDIDSIKVFEHYFPDMKKKGVNYRAACKWHTDTKNPNLFIYPDGHCHCYRCGAHYDVFGMVMHLDGVDFATSVSQVWKLGR